MSSQHEAELTIYQDNKENALNICFLRASTELPIVLKSLCKKESFVY